MFHNVLGRRWRLERRKRRGERRCSEYVRIAPSGALVAGLGDSGSGQLVLGEYSSNVEVDDNDIDGGWSNNPGDWSWHSWGQVNGELLQNLQSGNPVYGQITVTGTQNSGIELEASYVHTYNNRISNNADAGISIGRGDFHVPRSITLEKDNVSSNGVEGVSVADAAAYQTISRSAFKQTTTMRKSRSRATDIQTTYQIHRLGVQTTQAQLSATTQTSRVTRTHSIAANPGGFSTRYWGLFLNANASGSICLQSSDLNSNGPTGNYSSYHVYAGAAPISSSGCPTTNAFAPSASQQ